jgi:LL-diaminopimelate aminotransferase
VGSAQAIETIATVKTNIDSGIFNAVQRAGIAALSGPQDHLDRLRTTYQKRRDLVVGTLNRLGWDLEPPLGSIYVWLPTPEGQSSADFAELLLDRAGVVVAPGLGYGANGEGFVRISLTVSDELLEQAMERIGGAIAG